MSHLEMLATHYAAVQARLGMPAPKRRMALVPRPITPPIPIAPEPKPIVLPPAPDPEPETPSAPMPGEFPLLPGAAILAEVTARHGVTLRALKGESLARDVTAARAEACWRLRNELGWSWARVAEAVGRWDHTTAIAAYRRYEQILLGVQEGRKSTTREIGGRLYPSSETKRGEVMDFLVRNIGRPVKLSLIAKSTSVGRKSRVQNHVYQLRRLYGLEIESLGNECVRLLETPKATSLAEVLAEVAQ